MYEDNTRDSGWVMRTYMKKASLALCFGYLESRKFNKFQNIAARDAHRYVFIKYVHVRTCIYTYGVGSVLFVRN